MRTIGLLESILLRDRMPAVTFEAAGIAESSKRKNTILL